jgi:pimeloyl-ACP methyl ester carboxylesterase
MHKHLDGFDSIEEAIAAVAAYNPDRQRAPDPVGMRKNLRTAADGRLKWHWDPSMLSLDAWTESAALMAVLDRAARVPPIPTLLIRGLKSDVVVDDGIAALREKIPDLVVVDVADAGHMVAGDKNDLFNTGVVEFLRKHMPP